ncbi:MAG: CoA transferase [Dehalococcoidia bacterium]
MTRPLEGLRVVDFTWVRAGPWAARWLAILGADVIKVEWPDPAIGGSTGRVVRNVPGMGSTPDGVPRSMNSDGHFNDMHAMKRSVTMNLRSARGLELAKKLIAQADIVIENFSAGVLKSWGLSFPEMQAIKPDIIYVSMAGFGHTGPRAHFQTMGPSVQALSGLTYISGIPGKPPAGWGWSYMDDTGGMYGAIGALTALQHRTRTGEGQHVDLSQVAAGMTLLGPALLDLTANGRGSRREGFPPGDRAVWPGTPKVHNYRGPIAAPHNTYRTLGGGHNDWVGIVCQTDAQWQALKHAMGDPAWADARFDTLDGRLDHQDEMDQQIQAWVEGFEKYALTDRLQSAGVPAMAVQSNEDRVEHDPQLRARGMYDPASHPILGSWPMQHAPWTMSGTPTPVDRGAPICGEHNVEILCGMLGVSETELREGYADNTFWPKSVPLESYLLEALEAEQVR